jgi:FAD:protein FMN transferase
VNGFRSMGCDVTLPFGVSVDEVRELFDGRDARFSRFQPSSEINRVNAAPLGLTLLSNEFASMLSLSIDAARATGGLVSPCIGGALIAAGYDRDFSLLPSDVGTVVPAVVPPLTTLSLRGRVLLRVEPVTLDLNGVVKGRTVDDALALTGRGWVSAGGDIAAAEPVVVGLPAGGSVTLHGGGLATSSVAKRSWLAGGTQQNHLIDPRTSRPTTSQWLHVTVAGPSCYVADVAAKAALLLGVAGPRWLDDRGLAGRFVGHDGKIVLSRAWQLRVPETQAA